jgi:LysR family transcriptional regulator for bpeEF and oprC
MDHLAHIKAFIAIVEEGTLHAAAIKLHQTDAAISKKLSKLEASLDVILLERGHGKMKLTDIGQPYYQLCKEVAEKIANAKQLIQQVTAIPRGELKVHAVKHNADRYIMPKLKTFLQQYPEIQLTLTTSELIPDFSRGEVDILFGIAMPILDQGDNLVRKKIGLTRDILSATPTFLDDKGTPQKPKDLLALPYIGHTARRPLNLISFDNGTELQIQSFLKFDNHENLITAALQGLGYVYVKEYMVDAYLKSGQLVEILAKYKKAEWPIYVYYRYQAYPDPKVRVFMEYFTTKPF